jgi:hypothetical protein
MSNVLFGDDSDAKYLAPGFFLRVIANDFLIIRDESLAKKVRQPAERFVGEIARGFSKELDPSLIWNGFFDYVERKRDLFKNSIERRVYKENRTFTARALGYLAQKLFDDPFLSSQDGIVLRSLLIETDRLIRNHGAENKELILFAFIIALSWLDRYLAVALSDAEKRNSTQLVKDEINLYLKRIASWYSTAQSPSLDEATSILCDILIKWRKFYLRYQEHSTAAGVEERKIELPGQIRQKIGETIAEALQRDVSRKGIRGKTR